MSLLPRTRWTLFTACLVLILGPFAAGAGPKNADQPVQKLYDLGDLLVQPRDYTDAPHLGIETPEEPESATKLAPNRNELIERELQWIRTGLGADAAQVGLRIEDGKIRATGSPQAQQQIEQMLATARARHATQVSVEVRELVLSAAGEIPQALRARVHEAFAPGGAPVVLGDQDVQELLKAAQASGGSVTTAPRLTLFDGQRAYAVVSQQRAYCAAVGWSQVNGRRVSQPLTLTVSTGVVVKLRPAVDEDASHVALDLQFEEARLLEMRKQPATEPGQTVGVEVPVVEKVQVDRTLCAAGGRTVLIAIAPADPKAPAEAKPRVLLVKCGVIRPRPN